MQCAGSDALHYRAQMLFGRNIGDRLGVSDADFARFLDREISTRFPDGLTVIDAEGRWRDGGDTVREPSKLVIIVLPGRADDHIKLGQIAQAYASQFQQQAVLTTTEPVCSSLWRKP